MLSFQNKEQSRNVSFTTFIQHYTGDSSLCNKNEMKCIQIGKGELKLFLFGDNMIA